MDKLSLELLTNRRKYYRYLDKINPTKFQETAKLNEDLVIYRTRILNAIKEYLCDTSNSYNPEIDELFPTLIRQFIRYFETKDIEAVNENRRKDINNNEWHMDGPDEEDITDGYECELEEEEDEKEGNGVEEQEQEGEGEGEGEGEHKLPKRQDVFMTSYWGKHYIKKYDT